MFRPLLLLPSPHKKINELETRSASLTACYREPIRPRLLLVWSLLIAGSCWSHAHGNPIYSVTGLAVGSRVQFDSEAYHEYRCGPSQVFDGLTFCVKTTDDTDQRGPFVAYDGLLHSGDGTSSLPGGAWPRTRGQRCWVHKTANVLNKLPKSQQSKAKRALQEIWMAETKKDALLAFDAFIETWGVKYDRATECLIKDRDALLAFYDFPAEHWKHLRTTNVIESSFATVRHRTVRSKGCLSNKTALAMIFKLAEAAEKSWRRLDGYNQLPKVILGVKFADGIEVVRSQAQTAAA